VNYSHSTLLPSPVLNVIIGKDENRPSVWASCPRSCAEAWQAFCWEAWWSIRPVPCPRSPSHSEHTQSDIHTVATGNFPVLMKFPDFSRLLKKERIAHHETSLPSQSYGASPATWDHTVLPATWHKWTCPP